MSGLARSKKTVALCPESAFDPQQTLPYYWLLNETVEQFGEIRLVVLYENLLRHFPLWRRNHVLIAIHFVKLIRYQYCG